MTKAVTKSDIIGQVAAAADISRHKAEKAINAAFVSIATSLEEGYTVRIAGFGSFSPKLRAPRRCVLNGVEHITRQTRSVAFKPYETLKQVE